jgi:hypothetical protein
MNYRNYAALAAALTLAGCGGFSLNKSAVKDPGADRAQGELSSLQADPDLASRAPAAIKDAQDAVGAAETPQTDPVLASHLAYVAQRKVETARALAEARQAEDRLNALRAQRAQPPVVSTAPNGAPVVQLPQGQSVPLNPNAPVVQAGPATPPAPPAPPPAVTVPPMTQTLSPNPNAPVVSAPQPPAQAN